MVKNLSVDEVHFFITGDFIGAWNSLAANPDKNIGRGNFMFGRQAMNLLEFAARLCTNDSTGNALKNFSNELFKIELRYFFISLTGAEHGRFLNQATKRTAPLNHLSFNIDSDGDLELLVYPDILFLDFEEAIGNSGLRRNLSFPYLTRSFRKKGNHYSFNVNSLENSLITGGHYRI